MAAGPQTHPSLFLKVSFERSSGCGPVTRFHHHVSSMTSKPKNIIPPSRITVSNVLSSLSVFRHGRHYLLPGGPAAANESQVPSVWSVIKKKKKRTPDKDKQHTSNPIIFVKFWLPLSCFFFFSLPIFWQSQPESILLCQTICGLLSSLSGCVAALQPNTTLEKKMFLVTASLCLKRKMILVRFCCRFLHLNMRTAEAVCCVFECVSPAMQTNKVVFLQLLLSIGNLICLEHAVTKRSHTTTVSSCFHFSNWSWLQQKTGTLF